MLIDINLKKICPNEDNNKPQISKILRERPKAKDHYPHFCWGHIHSCYWSPSTQLSKNPFAAIQKQHLLVYKQHSSSKHVEKAQNFRP